MTALKVGKTKHPLFSIVERRRVELGLTQMELAYAAGLTRNQYRDYISCIHSPTLGMLNQIVNTVGLRVTLEPIDGQE